MTDGSAWPVLATGVLGDEARNLLDAIAGGVILQDARGFAVYANTAALEGRVPRRVIPVPPKLVNIVV